jgi:putative chitinase
MNSIERFQLDNRLIPDRIVGKNTLSAMLKKFGLSKNQLANFLGQSDHETRGFSVPIENLYYSKDRLLEVFPKYFNKDTASKYEFKVREIGNIVYSNRMGNGDADSGDGFRFRGRGSLNLSGRDNYSKFSDYIGLDCINNPDYVSGKLFFESGLFFFKKPSILSFSEFVDNSNVYKITKIINGGLNGFNERLNRTIHYYNLISTI